MPPEVLDRRALNRALLDRQLLLRRAAAEAASAEDAQADRVLAVVEHLAGLQAQAPFPPYYGLWSRLSGFRAATLARLLTERKVVRIALMRGTIHLVSARDCLMMRPLIQPVIDRMLKTNHGRQLAGVDHVALAAAGREHVDAAPLTFRELGALLSRRWPEHAPAALAQGVRALVPLVQVPPRAVWGSAGKASHTSAEAWLGTPLDARPSPDELVRRYLAAFGPATVADVQAWSGLTRLAEVAGRLRPELRTFRDENGRELLDLPDAPRPGPDVPAPARLIAEFDNLLLAHADRTRVMSEADRKRLFFALNGVVPGTVLLDGFIAGTWRIGRSRRAATLTLELFRPASAGDRDELSREGERLLAFAVPDAEAQDIRFTRWPRTTRNRVP
jgi:Winged helix DNA-binding domain